jgi:hypothetical protein
MKAQAAGGGGGGGGVAKAVVRRGGMLLAAGALALAACVQLEVLTVEVGHCHCAIIAI